MPVTAAPVDGSELLELVPGSIVIARLATRPEVTPVELIVCEPVTPLGSVTLTLKLPVEPATADANAYGRAVQDVVDRLAGEVARPGQGERAALVRRLRARRHRGLSAVRGIGLRATGEENRADRDRDQHRCRAR